MCYHFDVIEYEQSTTKSRYKKLKWGLTLDRIFHSSKVRCVPGARGSRPSPCPPPAGPPVVPSLFSPGQCLFAVSMGLRGQLVSECLGDIRVLGLFPVAWVTGCMSTDV
jgi:hypothetical protein